MDDQRAAIQRQFQKKLDDDRELEHKKTQLSLVSLQDKKNAIRNEYNSKLREMRRTLDKQFDQKKQ
jgi:hypothetical protein